MFLLETTIGEVVIVQKKSRKDLQEQVSLEKKIQVNVVRIDLAEAEAFPPGKQHKKLPYGVRTGSATRTFPLVTTTCEGSISGHGSAIFRISTRCSLFRGEVEEPAQGKGKGGGEGEEWGDSRERERGV